MQLARERGQRFAGFEQSRYASGAYFDKYLQEEWQPKTERVRALFARAGISARPGKLAPAARRCHALWHLQSLSAGGAAHRLDPYINHATSSIHPIVSKIEIRKEGKTGRVYYPAPFMNNDNLALYRDAYEIGRRRSLTLTPRRRATSTGTVADPVLPRYRHHPRYQQGANLRPEERHQDALLHPSASWRWKALKLKAACPARCKEQDDPFNARQRNQLEPH